MTELANMTPLQHYVRLGRNDERLARFGALVMLTHREHGDDLEAWWLHEQLLKCGLVAPTTVLEPCGDNCDCEPGDECYLNTIPLRELEATARGE